MAKRDLTRCNLKFSFAARRAASLVVPLFLQIVPFVFTASFLWYAVTESSFRAEMFFFCSHSFLSAFAYELRLIYLYESSVRSRIQLSLSSALAKSRAIILAVTVPHIACNKNLAFRASARVSIKRRAARRIRTWFPAGPRHLQHQVPRISIVNSFWLNKNSRCAKHDSLARHSVRALTRNKQNARFAPTDSRCATVTAVLKIAYREYEAI